MPKGTSVVPYDTPAVELHDIAPDAQDDSLPPTPPAPELKLTREEREDEGEGNGSTDVEVKVGSPALDEEAAHARRIARTRRDLRKRDKQTRSALEPWDFEAEQRAERAQLLSTSGAMPLIAGALLSVLMSGLQISVAVGLFQQTPRSHAAAEVARASGLHSLGGLGVLLVAFRTLLDAVDAWGAFGLWDCNDLPNPDKRLETAMALCQLRPLYLAWGLWRSHDTPERAAMFRQRLVHTRAAYTVFEALPCLSLLTALTLGFQETASANTILTFIVAALSLVDGLPLFGYLVLAHGPKFFGKPLTASWGTGQARLASACIALQGFALAVVVGVSCHVFSDYGLVSVAAFVALLPVLHVYIRAKGGLDDRRVDLKHVVGVAAASVPSVNWLFLDAEKGGRGLGPLYVFLVSALHDALIGLVLGVCVLQRPPVDPNSPPPASVLSAVPGAWLLQPDRLVLGALALETALKLGLVLPFRCGSCREPAAALADQDGLGDSDAEGEHM